MKSVGDSAKAARGTRFAPRRAAGTRSSSPTLNGFTRLPLPFGVTLKDSRFPVAASIRAEV